MSEPSRDLDDARLTSALARTREATLAADSGRDVDRVHGLLNRIAAGEDVLEELAREVGRVAGADLVVVERYDPMENRVRVAAHAGVDAADLSRLAPIQHDRTLFGCQLGEACLSERGAEASERTGRALALLGVSVLCSTPIRCGDQILGAISTGSRDPLDEDRAPHELLKPLADHLGAAWTAGRLLEVSRERARLEHAARDGWVLAHELRNPLHTVSLQLASLRHHLAELPAARRTALEEGLETVEQETRRLHDLLQHYLRLGRQRSELRRERVLLEDLLEGVLRFYELPLRAARIVVELDLPCEPVPVVVDVAQISQVFHNLLRNALDAMPGGGCLKLGARSTPGTVEIRLRDSGPGIDDPDAALAFFASTRPGGTGLGLPVSREILRAHGGDLAILPARGGASLVVSLPAVEPGD